MGQDVILRYPSHNLHEQGPGFWVNCNGFLRRACPQHLPNSSASYTAVKV